MAQISIPGGGGSTLTFSITGNAATNYANDFNRTVQAPPVVQSLSSGGAEPTVAGALNLIGSSSNAAYDLTTGDQYTFASVSSATTVMGSAAGGDTVMAGGGASYMAQGNGDRVIFFAGDNSFTGGNASGNTISGGTGADTINAGTGASTVFSGDGTSLISLSDTSPSGGDVAVLLGGASTVNAFGAADTVWASASALINGGAHTLTFVSGNDPTSGASPAAVTIVGGTGGADMFGIAGTTLTYLGAADAGSAVFVAGGGNETLNAAGAQGPVAVFADTVAADSSNAQLSATGGSGENFFMTGTGQEHFTGGSGLNVFDIDSVAGGNVTIAGFSAADYVLVNGLSAADAATFLSDNGKSSGGNYTVTLGNGSTVEFLGVSSLTGHSL